MHYKSSIFPMQDNGLCHLRRRASMRMLGL